MGIIKTNKHFFVIFFCYSVILSQLSFMQIELHLFSICVNIVHLTVINLESLFFLRINRCRIGNQHLSLQLQPSAQCNKANQRTSQMTRQYLLEYNTEGCQLLSFPISSTCTATTFKLSSLNIKSNSKFSTD